MSYSIARLRTPLPFRTCTLVIALTLGAIESTQAVQFTVGSKETIYTKSQRKSKGLSMWPDGNIGVVRNSSGTLDFYGANGPKPVKTTGTLTTPGGSKKSVSIVGLPKKTFDYVSGGPIYQDPASGARLMIYHAEKHGKSAKDYHSVLGLAISTDLNGLSFRDLGTVIEPNLQTGLTEVGGGSFAVLGDYLNIYYRDWHAGGGTAETAVARAPLADLVSNALSGRGTDFTKYYNGSWSQPGRGGMASALEVGNPWNNWSTVSYNDHLNQLVMISAANTPTQPDLFITTSQDGINWAPRQTLVADVGEQFYPTMIGTSADPTRTGQSFYVYYTDSQKGSWNRWKDAQLVRREITLDALIPAVNPFGLNDPISPLPTSPTDSTQSSWQIVGDFGDDFQIGGPAAGWRYAWNPTGTLGNSAVFKSLLWSNTAQAYNTTGGVTPITGPPAHPDDYLSLNATGGHPGQPHYLPIAGYTIQAEDGAGIYQLADSSIRKIDGLLTTMEDGLNVLVYVNNSLIGSVSSVSTNGLTTSFDRILGELNVGDTIWVMVDPLATQYHDSFTGFDFSIQKSVPLALATMQSLFEASSSVVSLVPEPDTAILCILALAACPTRRRRKSAVSAASVGRPWLLGGAGVNTPL